MVPWVLRGDSMLKHGISKSQKNGHLTFLDKYGTSQ